MSGGEARPAVSARLTAQRPTGHGGRATSPGRSPGPALRGRVALALIRDLALGEWNHAHLGKQIGLTAAEVRAFAEDHAGEVAEVSAALAGRLAVETAGLWISKKQNRVAELQEMYEDGLAVLAHLRTLPLTDGAGLGSRRHATTTRTQLAILGAVAAEYEPRRGQPGTQDDSKVVHYIIEGPETEYLT